MEIVRPHSKFVGVAVLPTIPQLNLPLTSNPSIGKRKWKDLVDEWVKLNPPEIPSSTIIADGEPPPMNMRMNLQNGHNQVHDFVYSPNPHNGSSGSERNNSEPEQKPKYVPRRDAPAKPSYQPAPGSVSVPPLNRPHKETAIDPDSLASARRRLHENYQDSL